MPNLPEGSATIISVFGALPGAGFNAGLTVPPRVRWHLKTINCQLQCAVAVANREIFIKITRGAVDHWVVPSQLIMTASQIMSFFWMTGWALQPYTCPNLQRSLALPTGILLTAGDVITTDVFNIQAADQVTNLIVSVEEWIEP